MLADPNDESPANIDAAKMWRENRKEFKKRVARCVRQTQEELWSVVVRPAPVNDLSAPDRPQMVVSKFCNLTNESACIKTDNTHRRKSPLVNPECTIIIARPIVVHLVVHFSSLLPLSSISDFD